MPNKTYEYTLPVEYSDFLPAHRTLLTPWFTRFMEKLPTAVLQALSSDWEAISGAGAVTLRNHLLTLTPKSVVFDSGRVWLALHANRADSVIMIHEPRVLTPAQIAFIKGFRIDSLMELCTHFYDAFEDVTPYANALAMAPEPTNHERFENAGDWLGGIYLYYVCTGDAILLGPDGRIGGWSHELAWERLPELEDLEVVTDYAMTLDDFMDEYVRYLPLSWDERKKTMFW